MKSSHIHDRQSGQRLLPGSFGRIQSHPKRYPVTYPVSVSDFWSVVHRDGCFIPAWVTWRENPSSIPLLIYPVLAMSLTLSWVQQGVIMIKLARYIRDEIEPKLSGLAWEQTLNRESKRFSGFSLLGLLATSGLIVVSQILAITLGWAIKMKNPTSDSSVGLLQIIAITATVITLVSLFVHGRMKR